MTEDNFNNINENDIEDASFGNSSSDIPKHAKHAQVNVPNIGEQQEQGAVFGAEAFKAGEYGRKTSAMKTGKYVDNYQNSPRANHAANKSRKNNNQYDNSDKPKKKTGWRVVFWLSITVMVAALIALGVIIAGYAEGCMMYNDIADDAFNEDESLDLASMKVDWDKLLAVNPETVAWVYMPGTPINYPVVHTSDNDKYLKTTFRGYKSNVSFGTIFMDCNNKHDLSDPNIVTYGHHMNDGSMYAQIAKLKNSEELQNHKYLYFLTPQGNYKLEAFSVVCTTAEDLIIQTTFANPESMVNYIQDKINRSKASTGDPIPDPALMSKIFTFSTCDYFAKDGRTLLFAYVVDSTVPGVSGVNQQQQQ